MSLLEHSHEPNQLIQNGALNKMTDLILLQNWIDTSIELWKPLKGFNGYDISNQGHIRSYLSRGRANRRMIPRLLKGGRDRDGYLCFTLRQDGKNITKKVHRLVALHFLPVALSVDDVYVNHKNNIPADNRVENLEWCSDQANRDHAKRIGVIPFGETHYKARLTEQDVLKIRATCFTWADCKEKSSKYHCSPENLRFIMQRKSWTHL